MYDYMYDTQMFDEPSEYQDETSRAYDRAETLYYVWFEKFTLSLFTEKCCKSFQIVIIITNTFFTLKTL